MSAAEDIPAENVWSSLDLQTRLEVVNTFRLIVKEMINEHFRFNSVAAPAAKGDHLCAAVEPQSGRHESRKPADAVRAA
jgi:hypothetical protein